MQGVVKDCVRSSLQYEGIHFAAKEQKSESSIDLCLSVCVAQDATESCDERKQSTQQNR